MNKKNIFIKYRNYILKTLKDKILFAYHSLFNSSKSLKSDFVDWLMEENINIKNKKDFVPISKENINFSNISTKLIAFYLPQYYENDVNNKYFGKGFMEWYNTSTMIPQFKGHYQPQIPYDVGFYNLSHDDIMFRQIELAKKYGIYGFCFYYYWFSGDRLLEKPINNFIKNKNLNIPFCLFWANESWTNIWGNGNHREIIKEQKLLEEDDEKFANDIINYFKDERYIKIDGKPLLIIYLSKKFEKVRFNKFLGNIRQKVKQEGFPGIHIMTSDICIYDKNLNFDGLDFDSLVEFSHMNVIKSGFAEQINLEGKFINKNFKGRIYDIKKALLEKRHLIENPCKTFRCVCAGWDNSARKAYKDAEVYYMQPIDYKNWLKDSIVWTRENHDKEEQIVFIDSWNEWAEGAHLEPDQKYGYAYLQATKDALEESNE